MMQLDLFRSGLDIYEALQSINNHFSTSAVTALPTFANRRKFKLDAEKSSALDDCEYLRLYHIHNENDYQLWANLLGVVKSAQIGFQVINNRDYQLAEAEAYRRRQVLRNISRRQERERIEAAERAELARQVEQRNRLLEQRNRQLAERAAVAPPPVTYYVNPNGPTGDVEVTWQNVTPAFAEPTELYQVGQIDSSGRMQYFTAHLTRSQYRSVIEARPAGQTEADAILEYVQREQDARLEAERQERDEAARQLRTQCEDRTVRFSLPPAYDAAMREFTRAPINPPPAAGFAVDESSPMPTTQTVRSGRFNDPAVAAQMAADALRPAGAPSSLQSAFDRHQREYAQQWMRSRETAFIQQVNDMANRWNDGPIDAEF